VGNLTIKICLGTLQSRTGETAAKIQSGGNLGFFWALKVFHNVVSGSFLQVLNHKYSASMAVRL
jgi:hypothetical protein